MMRGLTLLTLAVAAVVQTCTATRFVMYHDSWHPARPTTPSDRAGVTHLILAFAQANATASYQPHVPINTLRTEYPGAKLSVAIGGWGDTAGFSEATKTDAGITRFAEEIQQLINRVGVDGVDIDWEYPGGNGADYKQTPNSAKEYEIAAFPKLLTAIRAAIGKDKVLSIAVPGKKGDMIAFTKETGPAIWDAVDQVNVMAYDLMNRRDTVTAHHSSISGAAQAVQNYLDIGAPASKINLGFAYYAKYFTTAGDCTSSALNCPIVEAEDPITGKDTLTSGAWTYEKSHMQPVNGSVPVSNDGTCGAEKGTKCASGCCSQYGNCGTSKEHCSGACQHAFGTGCTDADIAGSWQLAAANGVTDNESGGQYFFDAANKLFWTWDTTQLMTRKFQEVVAKNKLGGVMAWSLGEDSYDWSHIHAMAQGVQSLASSNSAPFVDVSASVLQAPAAPSVYKSTNTKSKKSKKSNKKPKAQANKPAKTKYNVVYVDGVGGPDAEEAAISPLPVSDGYPVASVAKSKNAAAAAAANDKPVAAHPVVPVSGQPQKASSSKFRKTKYVEPGPDDDWEWHWTDENGKLLEKRAEGRRTKMRMRRV